jgi:hypothetical protein
MSISHFFSFVEGMPKHRSLELCDFFTALFRFEALETVCEIFALDF